MASRPGARNTSKIASHLLAAGLMLSTGYAFGLFTLGGCGGSQMGGVSPGDQQLPDSVMEKLTDCGKQGPKALTPVEYALVFTVAFTKDGQVQDVLLADSTLHVPEVEACMAHALHGLSATAEALPLRRRALENDMALAPGARPLVGQAQVVQALEIAALIVVGYLTYRVVVHYLVIQNQHKPRSRPRTEDPPQPEPPKPEPQTGGDPKTTEPPPPPPPPPPRRYPNQSCENDELDRLEAEKKKLCGGGYAAICNPKKVEVTNIPCSAILLAIRQRQACRDARKAIQNKCFGGQPDAGHKTAIEQEENAIRQCEALKLVNCAKGHSMAGR